jgi:hypothetical protein
LPNTRPAMGVRSTPLRPFVFYSSETTQLQGGGGGVKKSAPSDNLALLPNFLSENRQTRPGHPPTPRTPIYGRAGCEDRPPCGDRRRHPHHRG